MYYVIFKRDNPRNAINKCPNSKNAITKESFKKCHHTNGFVPKMLSPLGFRPPHTIKYTVHHIALNDAGFTEP